MGIVLKETASLAKELALKGINVYKCCLCAKCSSGCPLADYYDILPHQIIRGLQFDEEEKVFNSRSIWLCSSCQTCNTRCPQGIDVAGVIDFLRIKSQEKGFKPALPLPALFNRLAMQDIEKSGRLFELGLAVKLSLASGQPFRDLKLGLDLLAKGKLKLRPEKARLQERKIQVKSEKEGVKSEVAYYPGCSLHSSGQEFDISLKAVLKVLDIKLSEPENWVCCGSTPAHQSSPWQATLLPMSNLKLFQDLGFSRVLAPCAACFSRLKTSLYQIKKDNHLKEKVERELNFHLKEEFRVYNLLDFLLEEVGTERIKEKIKKNWKGTKVVCYYGCLISRPPEVTGWPHPEYPREMDVLMKLLGAEVLDWSYKTECCGGSLSLTEGKVVKDVVGKIVKNAKEVGAEAVIVACPLCHLNIDVRQPDPKKMPVFYLSEALGLSFGLSPAKLGLFKHLTNPSAFLKSKGFLS